MIVLAWWMRVVGLLYLVNAFMMAVVRAPIRSAGPASALTDAAAGEPTARFLIDTWIGFGLEVAAVGLTLLLFSRTPRSAIALVWAVIGIELARGILYDVYMIAEGYEPMVYAPWLVIHAVVIATGVIALRRVQAAEEMSRGDSSAA